MTIDEKLDEIINRLRLIEARQVRTTQMVEDVQEQEHKEPQGGTSLYQPSS